MKILSVIRKSAAASIVGLLASAVVQPGLSQIAGLENDKNYPIVRISTAEAPTVDGQINEEVWQRADVIDDFHQIRPVDGAEPSQRTEIRMLYSEDYLYVAGKFYETDMSELRASVMKHGASLGQDDRIAVILNPLNTPNSGYFIQTNAIGVRSEILWGSNTLSSDWTMIWDTASHIDDDGWSFEMAFPFKSLPFDPNVDSWGINFNRAMRSRGEEALWVSRDRNFNPSITGNVVGLREMDQGIGLDVVPALSLGADKVYDPDDTGTIFEPSLDAYYRLTPSLNASLTINTDFSAAEIDDRQVNLSRFSLFLPEKRDFFLNDADAFGFGDISFSALGNQARSGASSQNGRPFFSRRIGLSATGEAVDLNYGGKISGRSGRYSIGALAIRQDEFGSVDPTNIFVSRIQYDVLDESRVGFIYTNGDPASNLDNSVMGVDFIYLNSRIGGNRTVEGNAWYQQSDSEGISGDDSAFGFGLSMPNSEGLRGGIQFKEIQANFNPALGFVSRRDIRDYKTTVGYTQFLQHPILQSLYTGIDVQRVEHIEGDLDTQDILFRVLELETNSSDELSFSYRDKKENVINPFVVYPDLSNPAASVVIAAGEYNFDEYKLELSRGGQNIVSGDIALIWGDFYNGDKTSVNTSVEWRPSPRFNTSLTYSWNDVSLPQGDFATRLVQFKSFYALALELSWENLIQYDNVSEVMGINSRLRWVPRAGQEGFIVINHGMQDFDKDDRFESLNSNLTVKFSYTFRF